ncbi:reductive dehalogenase [Desulfitibacter alkalitolerans]|uniref:reductive dehalogenase n=1 Tax=Desulfitibacter alkalitolerans TaxID=264641 RepID=UPI00055038AB|nr:reductive dehalogenase [Desulfitibacter alkalitolerans]
MNKAANINEMYGIKKNYKRFNQQFNIMTQTLWNAEFSALENTRRTNLLEHVQQSKEGYSEYEYALANGVLKYLHKTGYGLNICDKYGNTWTSNEETNRASLPEKEMTMYLKKTALMLGASEVGIGILDRRWVYSHWLDDETKNSYPIIFSDDDVKYASIGKPTLLDDKTRVIPKELTLAIVLLFEMEYDFLIHAPGLLSFINSLHVYEKMVAATSILAETIRGLGFQAIPSINCTALSIPLAIDAGLGQMGRNGKLINPQFGSRCRIAKIITDLPLLTDNPIDFGVTKFCEACKKCARHCPANAITSKPKSSQVLDETMNPGYLRWVLNHKKCFQYWSECGTNCNICMAVCSYNRGYKWTKGLLNGFDKSTMDTILETLEDESLKPSSKNSKDFWKKLKNPRKN